MGLSDVGVVCLRGSPSARFWRGFPADALSKLVRSMKILAVDDDDTILDLLAEALALAGHDRISRARSAHEALGIIAATTTPFDCLLLDIQMPGMDGIALCRELRGLPRRAGAQERPDRALARCANQGPALEYLPGLSRLSQQSRLESPGEAL